MLPKNALRVSKYILQGIQGFSKFAITHPTPTLAAVAFTVPLVMAANKVYRISTRRIVRNSLIPNTRVAVPTFGQGFQVWGNTSTFSRLNKSTVGLTQSLYALRHKGVL